MRMICTGRGRGGPRGDSAESSRLVAVLKCFVVLKKLLLERARSCHNTAGGTALSKPNLEKVRSLSD